MNLVVDVGNTFLKIAVFEDNKIIHHATVSTEDFDDELHEVSTKFESIEYGIISNVGNLSKASQELLTNQYKIHLLTQNSKVPFKNKYATPKTLGVDRIALVCAAVNKFPDKNALIIDAGSCITYDFITHQKEYLGGAISPGLQMRFKSLHHFTANLPLLEKNASESYIGNTTTESILSGVQNGIIYEIEGVIRKYSENFKDLTVILTGGDMHFLSKRLKNTIFANSKFILEGLNCILEDNKHE